MDSRRSDREGRQASGDTRVTGMDCARAREQRGEQERGKNEERRRGREGKRPNIKKSSVVKLASLFLVRLTLCSLLLSQALRHGVVSYAPSTSARVASDGEHGLVMIDSRRSRRRLVLFLFSPLLLSLRLKVTGSCSKMPSWLYMQQFFAYQNGPGPLRRGREDL